MLKEFQKIYDLWISQKDNYDRNVYTSIIQNNIDSAKNVDELITALDTTNYSYSYRVDLQEIFTQIATDYPETKERIDKILFKREIAKIISPNYYGDNKDVNKIQKLDNIDEIIDVLSEMSSREKTKALAYIKGQRPDKAETIDLILPKLLILQNVSDWSEEEQVKKILNQSQNLDEMLLHIAKEGVSIKSFNIFQALQSIQNYYPEKTDTIQEITNTLTKAESYEILSDFYSNVFKLMQTDPEHSKEYIKLIRKQLNSDKNNAESLDVIYETLSKVRYNYTMHSSSNPIRNFLEEHPEQAVLFAELYVETLYSKQNTPDTFREASNLLSKVIDDIPEQSMKLIKKFYTENAEKHIDTSIKKVLKNNSIAAQEYLDFVKTDLDMGDNGSGKDYSSYLIEIIKSQPELVSQAEQLYKQHLESEIKSLEYLRSYHRVPEIEISTEQRIVDMLERLGKLYEDEEQSEFALNLIEHTLKTVDFHEPELTGNEEYDNYILQHRKDRKSDREIEVQIYNSLNNLYDRHPNRCLDVIEAGLKNNVKANSENIARLLKFINMTRAPKITDRVLDIANELWFLTGKEDSFKADMQEEVLETLQDIVKKSPEKAQKALPILLDMYEKSHQEKYQNNNELMDEEDIKPRRQVRKARRASENYNISGRNTESSYKRAKQNSAYTMANQLDIISVITDVAPETFEKVLPDLEKVANYNNDYNDDDYGYDYEYRENLSKTITILQKGIKVNPELTEKVMQIVVAVMSNSNYQGNYAKSLLSDIIYSTLTNSPDKLEECWQAMQTAGNFRGLCRFIKHTKDENFLRIVLSKKEDAYATKAIEFKNVKRIERALAKRKYIKRKLNAEYPNLPIEQQLIQAAYDVVNSGDEQKKKEFNEFILAEGEPKLSLLDKKVMDYLWNNCTQNNLDKVNALRSFYGLKVELKTGNAVDIDERTAVRKVFDRTWSSYERGTNRETKEPYYTELACPLLLVSA